MTCKHMFKTADVTKCMHCGKTPKTIAEEVEAYHARGEFQPGELAVIVISNVNEWVNRVVRLVERSGEAQGLPQWKVVCVNGGKFVGQLRQNPGKNIQFEELVIWQYRLRLFKSGEKMDVRDGIPYAQKVLAK